MFITVNEVDYSKALKRAYEDGFNKGKDFNKDDQNLSYRAGFNDGWHDCEASFELGNDFTDSIQAQAYDEGYVEGYNQHEYEMHQVMSERELDLKAEAFDEGYDQAIDDLIEAGVIEEGEYLDEDYSDEEYSEYEFGNVEDDEEEYCFSKELDRILKSGQEQYKADPSVPSMGNRYDENGKLCGFFINTGNQKIGGTNGSERKHSHYFKDVRHLDYIDVYQVCKLFPVDDDSGAITHARKKLLVAGGRGAGKDMIKDITEARDTLNRYLQIEGIE